MPNPFPGMNPYLENPTYWPTIHAALIHGIWAELAAKLPQGYRASIEERLYIVDSPSHFRTDVAVLETSPTSQYPQVQAVLVADAPEIVIVEEARETYIDIWWGRDRNELVASIELLSPANKAQGRGRVEYVNKQQALLDSGAHLLEIDLLRGGQYTVAVPQPARRTNSEYVICLHRALTAHFEVWPVSIRSRVPRIFVPLRPEDTDIVFDLGAILNNVYELGRLDDAIDYQVLPVPALGSEDEAWAAQILRAAGRRS